MTNHHETALVPHSVVRQIVAERDAALDLYRQFFSALEDAHRLVVDAEAAVNRASAGLGWPYVERHATEVQAFHDACQLPDLEQIQRVCRRMVDLRVWAGIVQRTELEVLMDATAKDDLRAQMQYVPERVDRQSGKVINQDEIARGLPEVTEENIQATIESYRDRSAEIWRRGIAVAFSKLDRRFRSHDGFKIGSRIILTDAFDDMGLWNHYSKRRDDLLDIERVFLVLDGRRPTDLYSGIVQLIDEERRGGGLSARQSNHHGDYFEARVFMNGNMHLWFRRPDLVEQVNRLLAEHYGAGLGWGKAEQEEPERPFVGAVMRSPARNFGLFPTPDELADRVIHEADLLTDRPLTILEPSAGTGQLARRAAEHPLRYPAGDSERHRVTCVEIQAELAAGLAAALPSDLYARVLCRDFLSMEPLEQFDRIIMNPPFDRQRDIDHVHHALQFLAPGGRLVAIMSASAEFSETAKAVAFRREIDQHKSHRWRDLPDGSFREHGTNVNVTLLTVVAKEDTRR